MHATWCSTWARVGSNARLDCLKLGKERGHELRISAHVGIGAIEVLGKGGGGAEMSGVKLRWR